ncbi:MAG: nicotinate (nicotinamide) nucleotide adenylyltransferase [Spirochaetes bacterium]|nr:MAG: nicotinate (nicotinamide) nucleotide adenylyltransferase [Spirochaetota bacterium]
MGLCGTVKTALLGGSFNPVHNGHLALAADVLKLGYQRIIFIPAARSPLKKSLGGASDKDRIAMLELALKDFDGADIWDGEIRRGGASYSIDTVRELISTGIINRGSGLIIGDDLARGFSSWKNADELASLVDIILARRLPEIKVDFPYSCRRLENRLWPYSSTEIRKEIAERGNSVRFLPAEVADYIERNALYADTTT